MSMIPYPEKKEYPEIYLVPCPNCGTVHQVTKWINTYHCLDGVHQLPIDKWAQRFAVCTKCGMLYSKAHNPLVTNPKVMDNPTYRGLSRNTEMSHEEKVVLMLIQESAYNAPQWERLLPRVYVNKNSLKHMQALETIEQYILGGRDRPIRMRECGIIAPQNQHCILHPIEKLVDIYRQMGEWEKALSLIKQLHKEQSTDTPDFQREYLKLEQHLIKKKNREIQ